jgi:hypothetical protein
MNHDDDISEFRMNRSSYESSLLSLIKQEKEYDEIYVLIQNVVRLFPNIRVEKHFRNDEGKMGIVIVGDMDHIKSICTELSDKINTSLLPYNKKIAVNKRNKNYTDYDIVYK